MSGERKTREIFVCGLVAAGILLATVRSTKADFVFSEPENLGPVVNSTYKESEFSMSFDGLELYFGSDRPGGHGESDIWVTTRATTDDDWGAPVDLGSIVNGSRDDWAPSISADKLSLCFSSDRCGIGFVESLSQPRLVWSMPQLLY